MVISEFETADGIFVDETAIDPNNINENAIILAKIDADYIAIETEDEKFQLKLDATHYAHDSLGSRIEPIIFTLPKINSTTMIINRILTMQKNN